MEKELEKVVRMLNISPKYKNLVLYADKQNLNTFIYNSTLEHATFLFWYLINKAKKSIKILSGSFNADIYNSSLIKNSLINKLKEDKNFFLEISLFCQPAGKSLRFLRDLNKFQNVSIKLINKEIQTNHFMVVDDSAFRIESIHEARICGTNGLANFNNPRIARKLSNYFGEVSTKTKLLAS